MTKLLDLWQPPSGAGRPVAAVTTTFTFDTDFFETQCLGRFLALDTQRGEGHDLLALIEEAERLAEVRVAVIVDRRERPEGRNLRWDLLTVASPGGLQHAKATVLVWERLVRLIVSSANLTPAGYRSQVETATAFDLYPSSPVPRPFAEALLEAVIDIAQLATGHKTRPGPKARVLETLRAVTERLSSWELAPSWPPGVAAIVAPSRPGSSPLDRLGEVWRGSVPRQAHVLSPFFDTSSTANRPMEKLGELLAQRGQASVRVCLPGVAQNGSTILQAPRSLDAVLPARVNRHFEVFVPPGDEPRRLHAKAIVLCSEDWVAALVGSSNFTTAGLGLHDSSGHVELNVWFGARAGTTEADALTDLVPKGQPVDLDGGIKWKPAEDDEDQAGPVLPLGFADCLLDPTPGQPAITLVLDHHALPDQWTVTLPDGRPLLDAASWAHQSCPAEVKVPIDRAEAPPFFLDVHWTDASGQTQRAGLPVNVTDPALLPAPDELRRLPASAVLAALASTRPIHEAVVREIERHQTPGGTTIPAALDPLKRHSSDGLFRRTRQLSAALRGLQERLEHPCGNPDALAWRLRGPFGPVAIAYRLMEETDADGMLGGEAAFAVAEIALTLARVNWAKAATPMVPFDRLKRAAHEAIEELATLVKTTPLPPGLDDYVRDAIAEACR